MSDHILLPGSIPGLLRRGSPCVLTGPDDTGAEVECDGCRVLAGELLVIVEVDERSAIVAGGTDDTDGPRWSEVLPTSLSLDLTDPTGRAHAAWWLWAQAEAGANIEAPIAVALLGSRDPADWLSDVLTTMSTGGDIGARDIGAVRAIVLHVAGVSP